MNSSNKIFNNFWGVNDFKLRLKKIFLTMGRDAFLVILFVLLIEVIFTEFLFYRYVLSVEIQESSSNSFIGFREKEYQYILQEWKNREGALNNDIFDNMSNPFQP
ncbi:MAG: hypothetical protein A3D35_02650 [Candidatus Staskawiczbacteria bacterium RIFCSPHIGHO2_02_FULL_34_9]|uniref:Uncharacterized protein n=1 Tax=Candidatus Staskawiczbacteria bacterium RIFCSPHIGHO2_02_FULL_34_9 TaxID=1802206 RepID=A0A1G2I2H1_9BACT|nr:MAG: hypothetical protein A3D35_02650 [Candidatus Staskawiczbacteria bacterium RIFCSPHIGHO2_02_FULL_34_9]